MREIDAHVRALPALAGLTPLSYLPGGPVCDSWLVDLEDRKAVLRIDRPFARQLGLDRSREVDMLELASGTGLAPEVIWADPDTGVLLKEYVEGVPVAAAGEPSVEFLREFGARVRALHTIKPAAKPLDLEEPIRRYANCANDPEAGQLESTALRICSALSPCRIPVLCHNDLGFANVLATRPPVLIDWEYAAPGDPRFDLAGAIVANNLSRTAASSLLDGYGAGFDVSLEGLEEYCSLYRSVSRLWWLAIEGLDPAQRSV